MKKKNNVKTIFWSERKGIIQRSGKMTNWGKKGKRKRNTVNELKKKLHPS